MTVFQKSTLTPFQRFVSRTTLLAGVTAAKLALISTGVHAVQLNQHTSFWLNRVVGSSGGGWVGDLAMKGVLLLSLVGAAIYGVFVWATISFQAIGQREGKLQLPGANPLEYPSRRPQTLHLALL
jgi:hypothetical protein